MARFQFSGQDGSFTLTDAENVTGLAFPIAGENGLKDCVTPNLGGDSKCDQNTFVLEPTSIENLHNNRNTRNFWCRMEDGSIWSVCGSSAVQEAERFSSKQEENTVTAGLMWHTLIREGKAVGLRARTDSFVTLSGEQEIMLVTLENTTDTPLHFTPVAVIPLYGRSADNLRDHRHVTSLLHRIRVLPNGVAVKPTLSFDERGHQKNHITYFAAANGANGELPAVIYPTVERFLGEGGTFLNPEAAHHTVEGVAPGTEIHGKEAVGGMEFAPVVLAPGQSVQYVVRFGMTGNETTLPQILAACDTAEKAETILVEVKKHWQEQVNVSFETGSREKDNYLRWICFQPILRRIYGCSFLPYHDYGKGGRGWRDLWQDCLALLIMNPSGVRQMIVDNYAGVRLDGTNATIIGEKQGEFVADRNNITRVWMDHAFWPLLTTEFYLNQTGDLKILLEKAPYFKDKQICRGTAHDDTWTPAEGCWQKDAERKLYKGTLLEHILLQNLCAFYDVGTHNELRLHNADWNDALDMAANKGESVAFTSAYAGNLRKIAAILGQMQERLDVQKVAVAEELTHLLGHSEYYGNAAQKQHILNDYQQLCAHANSGKTVDLPVNALQDDLNQKADWMMEHIRKTEWVTDGVGNGWLNGYYDDHGEQVEGLVYGTVRMMLPSQVFAIMSGTADEEQVRDICASADHYLYERTIGGYRLNTDFHEEKFDLGRMFGFAYGEKENGAVFSHMTVMYANALYQRGFARQGAKALDTLLDTAMNLPVSRMYPGLPEYFNNDGRGLYPYLTGAASWYMLTMICWVYGVRGELGDLLIAPALQAEQFGEKGEVSLSLPFADRRLHITLRNPAHKPQGEYRVIRASLDGAELPLTNGRLLITQAVLNALPEDMLHHIDVTLA
jgi:cellobiose phosphorylase